MRISGLPATALAGLDFHQLDSFERFHPLTGIPLSQALFGAMICLSLGSIQKMSGLNEHNCWKSADLDALISELRALVLELGALVLDIRRLVSNIGASITESHRWFSET